MRIENAKKRTVSGRTVWEDADGGFYVEGWPDERYESLAVIEHLLALEEESPHLSKVNRQIVLLGGTPIPLRRDFDPYGQWPSPFAAPAPVNQAEIRARAARLQAEIAADRERAQKQAARAEEKPGRRRTS